MRAAQGALEALEIVSDLASGSGRASRKKGHSS